MSTGLTDDDERRIVAFCRTPRHERDPEQLVPESERDADVELPGRREPDSRGSSLGSLARTVRRLCDSRY